MNLIDIQRKIARLMTLFVVEMEIANAQGDAFFNKLVETVVLELFREVYGLKDLKNLNREKKNFPGIDLGDKVKRVAIQATSTSTNTKIKATLAQFIKDQRFKEYGRLIIYIASRKQPSYQQNPFDSVTNGKFPFDAKKDILDFTDIVKTVVEFDLKHAKRVLEILKEHFEDNSSENSAQRELIDLQTELFQVRDIYSEFLGSMRKDSREHTAIISDARRIVLRAAAHFDRENECSEEYMECRSESNEDIDKLKLADKKCVGSLEFIARRRLTPNQVMKKDNPLECDVWKEYPKRNMEALNDALDILGDILKKRF